jgi:hypothetical protein
MTDTDRDHRVPIGEAFEDRTDTLSKWRYGEDDGDGGEQFLDVTVWRAEDHEPRVEFLLACGGPTERVVVDCGYESVTYEHSWGKDHNGDDCQSFDTWGDYRDLWVEVARDYAEWMP